MITARKHKQTTLKVTELPKCFSMTEVITHFAGCALKNSCNDSVLYRKKKNKTFF
jgi:hypothetical protein